MLLRNGVRRVAIRLSLACGVLLATVSPANALPPMIDAEVAGAEVDGIALEGRGYGHGRGLSQHGARGRAEAGHTYQQIVANYYPGTALSTGDDSSPITVWITRDVDDQTWVVAEGEMFIEGSNPDAGTRSSRVRLPAEVVKPDGSRVSPTAWRLRLGSLTFQLEGFARGVWYPHDDVAVTATLSNNRRASITAGDGTVRLITGAAYRDYRGAVNADRITGAVPAEVRTTVTTSMRHYLWSVVPAEMPALWHSQALAAQAVAARTYASYEVATSSRPWWYDTCDTTQCQVFQGVAAYDATGARTQLHEHSRTSAAVDGTAGRMVMYQGAPAFTQFSASNGGYSLGGSQPYLAAAPDPYDTLAPWIATLSSAAIETKYPQVGTFHSIAVTRDGRGSYGGRVVSATVTGSAGTATRTGDQFRNDFGLRSTMFSVTHLSPPPRPPLYNPQRDWNRDGLHDLVTRAPDGNLYFYAGRGPAQWHARQQIGKGWQVMGHMTLLHNFSGTRKPEIVTTDPRTGALRLYPGDGSGGFTAPRTLGHGWSAFTELAGVQDWHGRGTTGLVARDGVGRLWYYPGDGRGGFAGTRQIGQGWNGMDVISFAGDLDGDGRPDLIARDAATQSLWLYSGDGGGGVRNGRRIGTGWGAMDMILSSADWDRDGRVDVLARKATSGNLLLYPGTGNGGFLAHRQVGNGWLGFALVD